MKSYLVFMLSLLFLAGCQQSGNKKETATTEPVKEEVQLREEAILSDSVVNKSFVGLNDERFLRFELVVNKDIESVWNAFTTQEGTESWMAPKVGLDMRVGGSIKTITPGFPDVTLNVPSLIPNELLIYKVNLNSAFTKRQQSEGINLQEVIQFEKVSEKQTKVTATMMGWGKGEDWDKIYEFFEKNNRCAYDNLITGLNGGKVKWN